MMSKKSFLESIKEDFKVPNSLPERDKLRTIMPKAFPGARFIPIIDIHPDPNQPRKYINHDKLEELAASIKTRGVIQPLIIRPDGYSKYTIVAGERRFRAATIAALAEIPCIITNFTDQEALICQIIENVQREDLTPIEEANCFKKLTEGRLTQSEIASLVGKSQPYISQSLKILELPKDILKEAQDLDISKEHLLQLIKSKDLEVLWQEVKDGKTATAIKKEIEKERNTEVIKGRPKITPWTWRPVDKSFLLTIKFKKPDFGKERVITVLKQVIQQLSQ